MAKNLYDALGVPKTADPAAIRKAFRALAKQYHPDKNKEPGAETRFKEVTSAYEVLGDEQKRAEYDEFGESSLHSGFDANKARAWRNMGGGFGGGSNGGARSGPRGFSFQDMFGGGFNPRAGERPSGRRAGTGADIEGRVVVGLLDAIRGSKVSIAVERPGGCTNCNGEGGTGKSKCAACQGSGRVTLGQFGGGFIVQCDECGGEGFTYASECEICAGTGRVRNRKTLAVSLPAGVDSGQVIRLRGQGGEGRGGAPAGDLLLTVEVGPHPRLRRTGQDLEMDLPISLSEAVAGGSVEVPTPSGKVRVKIPEGSANGQRLRLPKKGIGGDTPGDLYLVLRPVMPKTDDPAAVELAKQLDALWPIDVREGFEI